MNTGHEVAEHQRFLFHGERKRERQRERERERDKKRESDRYRQKERQNKKAMGIKGLQHSLSRNPNLLSTCAFC